MQLTETINNFIKLFEGKRTILVISNASWNSKEQKSRLEDKRAIYTIYR